MPYGKSESGNLRLVKLNKMRKVRDLGLRELALASGVHFSSISRYENGLLAKTSHAEQLAAALGCPLSSLIGSK